jgi:hypothetical protein
MLYKLAYQFAIALHKMKMLISSIFIFSTFLKSSIAIPVNHNDQESSLSDLNEKEKEELENEVILEETIHSRFVIPDYNAGGQNEKFKKYQGDIILTEDQIERINDETGSRTGIIYTEYLWPKSDDGFVRVPYYIDQIFSKF